MNVPIPWSQLETRKNNSHSDETNYYLMVYSQVSSLFQSKTVPKVELFYSFEIILYQSVTRGLLAIVKTWQEVAEFARTSLRVHILKLPLEVCLKRKPMVCILIFNRSIKAARCKLETQRREGTEVRTEIKSHTHSDISCTGACIQKWHSHKRVITIKAT